MAQHIWEKIHDMLCDLACNRWNEDVHEVGLIVAVIIRAAKDKDLEYFNSQSYVDHCYWAALHPERTKKIIDFVWNMNFNKIKLRDI